jgi:excisionase family DNA binding protein
LVSTSDALWTPAGRLLTVREVAERLHVCASTVYKLCAEGRLAHVRVANAIRAVPGEVERLGRGERQDPEGGQSPGGAFRPSPRDGMVCRDKRNTRLAMPKTVETYRTTKELRALVRRAAKAEGKRPSEFLRQAAEERARAVLAAAARDRLADLLARLPPGRAGSEAAAERIGEEAARAGRARK